MPFKRPSKVLEKIWKSADRGRPPASPASSAPTSTSGPRPHAPPVAEPEPQERTPTTAAALRPDPCNAQTPRHNTPDTASPSGLPSRLWTQAYDAVKDDKPDLVDAYETLLRRVLGGESDPADQRQMDELIQEGLEKTKKEAAAKKKVEEGIRIISSISNLVGTAVKHAPEAAAAWGGVCLLLQVLENPIKEAAANRDGMTYVVSRMNWYLKLSSLLEENREDAAGLRYELEQNIVALYKKLLSYQMESVCSCYRNRGFAFLRDIVTLDDWTGTVQSLKDAEVSVQRDIDTHVAQEMRMSLNKVAKEAENRRTQLGQIHQTLQDFISMQKDTHKGDAEAACRKDLRVVDPQHDMQRIENDKGGLLPVAYEWILRTQEYVSFTNWDDSGPEHPQRRLLWIKGHAGTGKTMLMIGIIRELSHQPVASARKLTYFFCQGTNKVLNNATAVLRSLIWLLLLQQPCLMSHLLQKHKDSGEKLFNDENAFHALSEAFQNMLKDPGLLPVYLAVDALDECEQGRSDIIHLISTSLTLSPKVRWLLSSRPEVDVLGWLRQCDSSNLCAQGAFVELDTESLEGPVSAYIKHKLCKLQGSKLGRTYTEKILETVSTIVHQRAKDNFLWVFLVFNDLKSVRGSYAVRSITDYPSGLSELYDHKMDRIEVEETKTKYLQHCKDALVMAFLAYRPLSLDELAVLVPWAADTDPYTIIEKCSSFLTITGETVKLVHQSAKDYLEKAYTSRLQPAGPAQGHADIGRRSIVAISKLKKNMYNLDFDSDPEDMTTPDPDPLAPVRYSCIFWADHLCSESPECRRLLMDDGLVLGFLSKRFLRWLESLSLLGNLSDGILSIRKLLHVVKSKLETSPRLTKLLEDAEKFVLAHRSIIERAPLQTYGSALVFSPTESEVRKGRWKERLSFIKTVTGITDYWGAHRQTLEGHSDEVATIAFSPDGKTLASASYDQTIRLWDAATGVHQQTLKGHSYRVTAVAFSPDGKMLASASYDQTIRLWDAATGVHQQTLKGHSGWVKAMAFSPDGKTLALASIDKTIWLWDAATGMHQQTLEGHSRAVAAIAFSPNGKMLMSASYDKTIRLWDAATGVHQQTLEGHSGWVRAVAFSPDGKTLASASDDKTIRLWDAATGVQQQTLEGHSGWVRAVAFSPDGKTLASASDDKTIRLWDAATGVQQQTLEGHSGWVRAVAFSPDGKTLASASDDETIRLWDAATGVHQQTLKGHSGGVRAMAFSPDGKTLASASDDKTIRLWDAATGVHQQTLEGHSDSVTAVAFSPDGKTLASVSYDQTIRLWDAATGVHQHTLKGHSRAVAAMAFSPDGKMLMSASYDKTIRLWDAATGVHQQTLKGHSGGVRAIAFSPNGKTLASASDDKTIRLWDAATGVHQQTLKGHSRAVAAIAFSPDGKTHASASIDKTIRLWDAATGVHQQTVEGHSGRVRAIAFSPDGHYLETDQGLLSINLKPNSSLDAFNTSRDAKLAASRAYFVGGEWIARDGKNLLWLPPSYRATCVAVYDGTLVLGHATGQMTFLYF